MRRLDTIAAAALVVAGGSCRLQQSFRCQADDNCTEGVAAGYCELSGFCSFDDTDCESGRRYGEYAASELAGTCVNPSAEGTQGTQGTQGTPDTPGTTGTQGTTGVASTSSLEDSSTSNPIDSSDSSDTDTVEICDGIDNDGDGLIDEYAPGNETCEGCALSEVEGRALWACAKPWVSWGDAQQRCEDRFAAQLARLDTEALRQAGAELAAALESTTASPATGSAGTSTPECGRGPTAISSRRSTGTPTSPTGTRVRIACWWAPTAGATASARPTSCRRCAARPED